MSKEIIYRRAETIANLFLQELQPVSLMHVGDQPAFGDFFASFLTPHNKLVTIVIEVKATMTPIKKYFRFTGPSDINVPALILAVDVKMNSIFFNWISQATEIAKRKTPRGYSDLQIPVRKLTEASKKALIKEIYSL